VEDHSLHGGFGSAVLEALAPFAGEIQVQRLGLPDRFLEHAAVEDQWREAGIDVASIVAAAARQVGEPALSRAAGA
jgi:1-deoxy-D-xylulose-5-phosphate synthase